MRSRATSCRTIADIDWGNRIIRPSSGGLESPCRNRRPTPDQLQWNLPKHQSAVELMELALAALPALAPIHPKCCMNMDYWASGERERGGEGGGVGRVCWVMALRQYWYGWTVAELLNRVEWSVYVQAVVMHVISASQSVSQRHERCMTQHSSGGRAHTETHPLRDVDPAGIRIHNMQVPRSTCDSHNQIMIFKIWPFHTPGEGDNLLPL